MVLLFAIFAGFFPRLATLFIWLARPARFDAAFSSWIWSVLGIIFLPFTTLMYVILWSSSGLTSGDWFWLIIAIFLDLSHYASAGTAAKQQMAPAAPAAKPAAPTTTDKPAT